MTKPNCYDCQHRRSVPGDAHSRCVHPSVGGEMDMIMNIIGAMMGNGSKAPKNPLNIAANPHGVANGWFMHPMNFDPCWLERCDGFLEKQK